MAKQAVVDVILNNEVAKARIIELEDRVKNLIALKMKALKDENTPLFDRLKAETKAATQELNKLQKQSYDVDAVLKNISGASINDLRKALSQATLEMNKMERAGVSGYDEQRKKVQALKGEIHKVNTSNSAGESWFGKMSAGVNKYFGLVAMGAAAVYGAARSVGEFLTDWDTAEQSEKKLQTALKGRESIMTPLMKNAAKLQDAMNIPHEVIESQEAFLASQGRTEDQIKKTMKAAIQMAADIPGMDISGAVKQLDSSYSGVLRGLNRLDPAFKLLTKEQLENGAAVDLINEKYQGFAETAAKEGIGPLKQLGLVWTDIKGNLGGMLASVLVPLATGFSQLIKGIREVTKPSESMVNQFYEQAKSVTNLQNNISPLLDRYDQLKSKTQLSKNEHIELKKIIGEVTDVIPSAASAFDQYGKTIAINTGRARQFIDAQAAMMGIMNKKAIDESKDRIAAINNELHNATNTLIEIETTGTFVKFRGSLSQNDNGVKASIEEIESAKQNYVSLVAEKQNLYAAIAGLSGDAYKDELKRRAEEEKKASELAKKSSITGPKSDEAQKEAEKAAAAKKKQYEAELKVAVDASQDQKNLLEKQHNDLTINDATFHVLTLQADFDFLQKKIEIEKKNGQSSVETQNEYDKKVLDAEAEKNALILKAQQVLKDAKIDNVQNEIDKQIAKEDDVWTKEQDALKEQFIIKENLTLKEIELNDLLHATIEEKTKAHNERMLALANAKAFEQYDINELSAKTDIERWDAQAAKAKATYDQEIKLASTDQKKILTAEKKYKDDSLRIQDEKLDKERELGNAKLDILNNGLGVLVDIFGKETALGKAAFYAQQATAIAQVIFNTIIANKKAVAAFPVTLGQPWVALNTASAVVDIGVIMAQTFGAGKGKKSGGYADDGSDDAIAGYYHANEFINSADAVRNPTIKPVLDIIDYAQRSGTVRSINLPAVIAATFQRNSPGKKDGGFASPAGASGSSSIPSFNDANNALNLQMLAIMKQLSQQLDIPIRANVLLTGGTDSLEYKQKQLAKIQQAANF